MKYLLVLIHKNIYLNLCVCKFCAVLEIFVSTKIFFYQNGLPYSFGYKMLFFHL